MKRQSNSHQDKSRNLIRPAIPPPAPAENAGRGTETDALAELVWKHFGEEITQVLREVQDALATEEEDSREHVSQRK